MSEVCMLLPQDHEAALHYYLPPLALDRPPVSEQQLQLILQEVDHQHQQQQHTDTDAKTSERYEAHCPVPRHDPHWMCGVAPHSTRCH